MASEFDAVRRSGFLKIYCLSCLGDYSKIVKLRPYLLVQIDEAKARLRPA